VRLFALLPPSGKTLLARQIGKLLTTKEPKVVAGPELLNKFVGASEENVRKLFAEAEEDLKANGPEKAQLHIIIVDECDALFKARGSGGDSTGVHDGVVTQLLSKLDGVHQVPNLMMIGMTNRKSVSYIFLLHTLLFGVALSEQACGAMCHPIKPMGRLFEVFNERRRKRVKRSKLGNGDRISCTIGMSPAMTNSYRSQTV
jgi:hypothetical protein